MEQRQNNGNKEKCSCNTLWRVRFPESPVRHLPALNSNHNPLVINTTGFAHISRNERPFRFLSAWQLDAEFNSFVKTHWNDQHPIVPFLKRFAENLKTSNKEIFENIFQRKRLLRARLEGAQRQLVKRSNLHLLKLEAKLRRELDDTLIQEESIWHKK